MTKIQSQRKGLQLNPIHRQLTQLWTTLELQPSTKLPCKMQNCNKYGSLNNFVKVFRKPKRIKSQTSPPQQTNVNQIESTPDIKDVEESIIYVTSNRELYEQAYDSNYDNDSDNYVAAFSSKIANMLEPLNSNLCLATSSRFQRPTQVVIAAKDLDENILKSVSKARWTTTTYEKHLKTISNEPIEVPGKLATTVNHNDWICDNGSLAVLGNGYKNFIGLDLFNSFGLAVVQQQFKRG